jgi:signal transduction histidine kinase
MLGHDMRSPLNTVLATASYLAALNAGEEVSVAATRLIRSGASMQALLDDLVDFNRTKLGLGLNIVPASTDLAAAMADEVEQLRGAFPARHIEFTSTGETQGRWDGLRLQQLLRNLVANAIRYGHGDAPVRVMLRGGENEIRLEVTNEGPAIDPSALDQIFDPLKRGAAADEGHQRAGGLGLGLFIVREITRAHRGTVEVHCKGGETTFSVRLPRPTAAALEGQRI